MLSARPYAIETKGGTAQTAPPFWPHKAMETLKMVDNFILPAGRNCTVCKKWKTIEGNFWVSKRDGVLGRCKACTNTYQREYHNKNSAKVNARQKQRTSRAWSARGGKPAIPVVETEDGRLCSKCNKRLPRTEFSPHKQCHGGLSRRCKACARAQHSAWVEKNREYVRRTARQTQQRLYWENPERFKAIGVKHRYKITLEEVERIREAQGDKCSICLAQFVHSSRSNQKPCVDHDHATNKFRGVICNSCNTAIGMVKDNPDIADAVAVYLRKHR